MLILISLTLSLLIGGNIIITAIFKTIDKRNRIEDKGISDSRSKIKLNEPSILAYICGVCSYSMFIGYLERLIFLLIVVSHKYELLTPYLALKGLIRFPEINKGDGKITAEKFICGTLINLVLTLFVAFLINWLQLI